MAKTPYNQNLVYSMIDNKKYLVYYNGKKAKCAEKDGFWVEGDYCIPYFVYWQDADFELINVYQKIG